MRLRLLFLLLIISLNSFAQSETHSKDKRQAVIDSLKVQFRDLYFKNPDAALRYVNNALPHLNNDPLIKRWKNHFKGTYYFNQQNADSCIKYYNEALKNLDFKTDPILFNESHILLSQVYVAKRDFLRAKNHLTIVEKKLEENYLDNPSLYINLYRAFGNYYNDTFESKMAIEYYLKALDLLEVNPDNDKTTVNVFVNLGELFFRLNEKDKAESYFLKGRNLAKKINFDYGYHFCNLNLIEKNLSKNYYTVENLSELQNAEEFFTKINAIPYVLRCKNLMGDIYFNRLEFKKAENTYLNALAYAKTYNDKNAILSNLINLANSYRKQGKIDVAIDNLQEALTLSEEIKDNLAKSNILYLLSNSYKMENKFELAHEYLSRYKVLNDSINYIEKEKEVKEIEAKYQSEKQEKEIQLLKAENELIEQQKHNQRNLLLGGIGITTLAGLFLFFLYRNRKKTNRKLKELDEFKSKLFANISHEFRTPLTLISGYSQKRLEHENLPTQDKHELLTIYRNSNRLEELVNQMLDLAKLESGHLKMDYIQGDLTVLLKSIATSFQYIASEKSIDYIIDVENLGQRIYDIDIIEKITTNLLSNAFKYSPEKGMVIIEAQSKPNSIRLFVKNTTVELTKEQVQYIFNRFYQVNENSTGVGIGLSLVKELVELSKGDINVSQFQGMLVFEVTLPIQKVESKNTTVVNSFQELHTEESLNDNLMLIIEDNADIRALIKELFKDDFKVLEAENGLNGWNVAIEQVPNIIITDVKMPEMDGFVLTSKLKSDERTSHIPIILLTAKVEDQDKYQGLETGADDYILKPFKANHLQARVKNLINIREKLKSRYTQELILIPKDISLTNVDELFLQKLQKILDENLTESTFNVQDFSSALGMSRMQLHRKLKALTGLTATEFIRSQRLKLAAELLKKSDANISEIGYTVGFNDHSYFAKCFKEAYGCSPTDYVKKHQ